MSLQKLVNTIISFRYRREHFTYFSHSFYSTSKRQLKSELEMRNISNGKKLKEQLDWLWDTGVRYEFQRILNTIKMTPPEDREEQMRIMPKDGEHYPLYQLLIKQMYRIPKGGIVAIDMTEYLLLITAGKRLGYLSEQEADQLAIQAVKLLQQGYQNWIEFIYGYSLGQQIQAINYDTKFIEQNYKYFQHWLYSKKSPFYLIDWQMDLSPENN
ncbi:DUF1266 domain-containing protein [Gracilibacillus thailandensis]|uniref:DUF1266 domain-containing protein n=1 Tax=Gracilibacillus thailandensis TaxID=563735 RepID=A0A6N7QWB9_9BACI|nr:DUF1266 domain-containing protein [Gracilibacillus thailandensis]MRI66407.1 DUF1266 domain-containing protein [Gracilibacillus thailandensis]